MTSIAGLPVEGMNMSTCISNSGNGNGDSSQDADLFFGFKRFFGGQLTLLPAEYAFLYEQSMEAAKRHNKDLSWLNPGDTFEKRSAAAKANGWAVGAGYCRCSTKMQDSYEGQMIACIDKAIASNVVILPEMMVGDKAVSGKRSDRAGVEQVKKWVLAGMMSVLVAFSVTRMYRRLHTGLKFVR